MCLTQIGLQLFAEKLPQKQDLDTLADNKFAVWSQKVQYRRQKKWELWGPL